MIKSICSMFLVGIVLVVASSEVFAQDSTKPVSGWFDLSVENSDGETIGAVKTLVNIDGETIGINETDLFIWAQAEPGYAQIYGGPTWTPKPYVSVGVGPGIEKSGDKVNLRIGGYVYVGKGPISNVTLFEFLGSGPWYKNQTAFDAGKGVTLSLVNQRYAGTGPEIEFRIPKTSIAIRANALTQRGGTTVVIAGRIYF